MGPEQHEVSRNAEGELGPYERGSLEGFCVSRPNILRKRMSLHLSLAGVRCWERSDCCMRRDLVKMRLRRGR